MANGKSCKIFLLDGGLGTTLCSPPFNITFNDDTPLWSSHLLITSPQTLLSAQKSFVTSGADVIITASYQSSFSGFAASGYGPEKKKEVEKMMRSSVRIARNGFDGSGRNGIVALSLGAYGAVMVPSQEYGGVYDEGHDSVEGLREWHLERLGVFLPASGEGLSEEEVKERRECWDNVDLIAFETLPLVKEIIAARESIFLAEQGLEEEDKRPFWISCVFPEKENRLPDGSTLEEVVQAMLGKREGCKRPMGIGINCTNVGKIEGLLAEFEKAVEEVDGYGGEGLSLVLYPDGTKIGESYNTTTHGWEINDAESGGGNQASFFHLLYFEVLANESTDFLGRGSVRDSDKSSKSWDLV
jgi:homocysteine S-methyltransferase